MFCLRSWIPLLFIPTNASLEFILLFFTCTYFLNRPCPYCSVLLFVLFITSCNWSDRCFFDFATKWFQAQSQGSPTAAAAQALNGSCPASTATLSDFNSTIAEMASTTATALTGAALDELARQRAEWTGLGMEWLRSLLGRREWRIDCLDISVRL